jgi:tRNA (guanine10-N2)-dimethyltransferase
MALLIELSGEVLDLASQEACTTATVLSRNEDVTVKDRDGPVLVLEAPGVEGAHLASRLGLAHHVSDGAVSGELEDGIDLAAAIDIGEARSFRVRVHRSDGTPPGYEPKSMEAEVGARIRGRTGAKVDLDGPDAEVRLVLGEKAHAGLMGGRVDRRAMEGRAVKHRPFSHPVSIHPKFARAMVNLSGVPPGSSVMDPFCGTGGILIEAALMGYRAIGSDIDPRMVDGSRMNLDSLGLDADLHTVDVSRAADGLDVVPAAIVTDPPYGRSTSLHGGETGSEILRELASL